MVEVDDADFGIFLQHGGKSTKILQNKWWTSRLGYAGVVIGITKAVSRDMLHFTLHAYSERLCALHLSFRIFACYFPASWATDADVEGLYFNF